MSRFRSVREGGAALYMTMVALVTFVAISVAMVTVSLSNKREREESIQRAQRRYLAEAGIADSIASLRAGEDGAVGTDTAPVGFGSGTYFVTTTQNDDGTRNLDSTGAVGSSSRRMRAVVRPRIDGVWSHALFAGNAGGDGSYDLALTGRGTSADSVTGSVYSGGDVTIREDATVSDTIRAGGSISGAVGEEGITQPLPDLVGMNYPVNNDVNVTNEFSALAFPDNDPLGGTADTLPESSPAHIFRRNPSDRTALTDATAKDDYFLEDPYEVVNSGVSPNSDNATSISLSGLDGKSGPVGNDLVYYIDGNLWLHNNRLNNLIIKHQTVDVRVTFVVTGNVYIDENFLIRNDIKDGIAFVALKDPDVPDSGNIYIGDGTTPVALIEAFMYAENNVIDTNRPQTGGGRNAVTSTEIVGVLAAGNQIISDRTIHGQHLPLNVVHDERVVNGKLEIPGLPKTEITGGSWVTVEVLSVYEVGAP